VPPVPPVGGDVEVPVDVLVPQASAHGLEQAWQAQSKKAL
jgi:hypothetical protein